MASELEILAPIQRGAKCFDDEFATTERWGTQWAPSWFGGARQNNVVTDPANKWIDKTHGHLVMQLRSEGSGALVSTNPVGGATPGFTMGYGVAAARLWLPTLHFQAVDWCSFFTTGQNWPGDGENDVVEVLNGGIYSPYHSDHGPDNGPQIPGLWAGGWHEFALERKPGRNRVFFDGTLVRTYPTFDNGAPHYLVLVVGAAGPVNDVVGSRMLVDWVRAWDLP